MPGNRIYPQPRRGPTTGQARLRARRARERPKAVWPKGQRFTARQVPTVLPMDEGLEPALSEMPGSRPPGQDVSLWRHPPWTRPTVR